MSTTKQKHITVIGDGGWGTALAIALSDATRRVTVWGPFEPQIEAIRNTGKNETFLPGIDLPREIEWTTDRAGAVADADLIILAVPSRYFHDVATSFAGHIDSETAVVSVAKGLEVDTHRRMTEVARTALDVHHIAALSGPSHAEEVARGIPTAVVLATRDDRGPELQEILGTRRFRVYLTDDVCGVELGGAMKNVIAVAVGVSDGLGFGDNTRAALISRGLAEMTRLGVALGATAETFAGLSGMGDLIVTCTSRHSRNRSVGERIGKGETIDDIMTGMQQVAEGVWNCAGIRELALQHGVEAPITDEVYAIVHERRRPSEAVESLLSRPLKTE